MLDNPTSTWCL